MPSTSTRAVTTVTARLDYGIGRILRNNDGIAVKQRECRFQSFLIIAEAKAFRPVNEALHCSSFIWHASANPGYEKADLIP